MGEGAKVPSFYFNNHTKTMSLGISKMNFCHHGMWSKYIKGSNFF